MKVWVSVYISLGLKLKKQANWQLIDLISLYRSTVLIPDPIKRCVPFKCQSRIQYIWDLNWVITVSADDPAPDGARPSPGMLMTVNLDMFSVKFLWLSGFESLWLARWRHWKWHQTRSLSSRNGSALLSFNMNSVARLPIRQQDFSSCH